MIEDQEAENLEELYQTEQWKQATIRRICLHHCLLDAREYAFIKDLLLSTLLMHLENCIRAEIDSLPLPEIDVFTVAQFRSTLHVFRYFDTDRNGMLSSAEMTCFRDGYFNAMFLQRVFDISMTQKTDFWISNHSWTQ